MPCAIPDLTFFVIPRLDRGISSQNRDPRVKLGDDIVGNSRIPKNKSRFPSGFSLGILDLIFIFLKERFLLALRSCRCAFLHLCSKYQKKLNIA